MSASYHNPLWVAERAVQLDHMTRGRFMLGLGPGALPSDAEMIGLDMPQTRELLEDAVDVIVRLMRSDDPVSFENGRWSLRDARLHLRPYTHPHPEIAIAAVASPSGPRLAGRYGLGLLSVGATTAAGFDVLALHWDVMEERAAHYGVSVDRDAWRLVGLMHLADTREQAYRDVEHGIAAWFDYFQHTAAFPQMAVGEGTSVREFIDFVNESGLGTIGTPDEAVEQIERLVKQSNGGFGSYLQLAHDWAPPARSGAATSCSPAMSRRGSRDRRRRPSTPRRGPGPAGPSSPRATSRRSRCRRRSTRPSATRRRRSAGRRAASAAGA